MACGLSFKNNLILMPGTVYQLSCSKHIVTWYLKHFEDGSTNTQQAARTATTLIGCRLSNTSHQPGSPCHRDKRVSAGRATLREDQSLSSAETHSGGGQEDGDEYDEYINPEGLRREPTVVGGRPVLLILAAFRRRPSSFSGLLSGQMMRELPAT